MAIRYLTYVVLTAWFMTIISIYRLSEENLRRNPTIEWRRNDNWTLNTEKLLKKIYNEMVHINPECSRKTRNIVNRFVEQYMVEILKVEPSLADMNPEITFVGSSTEGLKICSANECDVNVVLVLPYPDDEVIMDASDTPAKFTQLYVPIDKSRPIVKEWCEESGRISTTKFGKWRISLSNTVLSSMRSVNIYNRNYIIRSEKGNVAEKVVISDEIGFSISIDIVFVFKFYLPKIPKDINLDIRKVDKIGIFDYFLVPMKEEMWKMSLSSQEKILLKSSDCKEAMKLVKYILQVHDIKVYSYALKTLFLWSNDLASMDLSTQTIVMLEFLKCHLFTGFLPDYWFHQKNWIYGVSRETLENWCRRLTQIIKYLQYYKEEKLDMLLKPHFRHKSVCRVFSA